MCFDGENLIGKTVEEIYVAERLLACWNKHIHESVEAIQGWK